MRTFQLYRTEDASGVSGTGVVAVGVQFPSGKCVMEWVVVGASMGLYDNIEILETIHGHEGRTKVIWDE